MLRTKLHFLFAFLFVASAHCQVNLDSLLQVQSEANSPYADEFFKQVLDARNYGLTPQEAEDLKFLAAYLPVSDIASMSFDDLAENVRLARLAKRRFSWGTDIPDEIFRHFVLPHRISQEPFVRGWRDRFLSDLSLRVDFMTMNEAALEVNHWCYEHATFQRSSGRDQDPLTTIRAGLGRCEEEMILTIAALRSISIPARQCYTPYWAHSDNNHAWVEVWVDGKWYYIGGCEPKPTLSDAWFTQAAGRAMLVVSTAYGDYYGDEPVMRRYGNSTLINSTAVYGKTRKLNVSLFDKEDQAVVDQRIIFSLYNYGGFIPAAAKYTNEDGNIDLTCGMGTWLITAGIDSSHAVNINKVGEDSVRLDLAEMDTITQLNFVDYTPPPPVPKPEKEEAPEEYKQRLEEDKEYRERNLWTIWARELGLLISDSAEMKPDTLDAERIANAVDESGEQVLEKLLDSRGNWGTIYKFVTNIYPASANPIAVQNSVAFNEEEMKKRWKLIKLLTKKDLRDFSASTLTDHYNFTTVDLALKDRKFSEKFGVKDSIEQERYLDFVVKPRIDYEPSRPWREELIKFFNESNNDFIQSKNDEKLIKWLNNNIEIVEKPDRMGTSALPVWTLKLRHGSERDIARLYVALCRVRGIPARFNPVSGRLERWDNSAWEFVELKKEDENQQEARKKGEFVILLPETEVDAKEGAVGSSDQVAEIGGIPEQENQGEKKKDKKLLYLKDWAVAEWKVDHFNTIDLGYHEPFDKITFPQEVPVGLYCLTTGIRTKDGSAPVKLVWFEVKEGEKVEVALEFLDE